jgi:GNAT superfamily N-acetyltransferase
LTTRHAGLCLRLGEAARYRPEVSALGALSEPSTSALGDLATLVEPGGFVIVAGVEAVLDLGPDWRNAGGMPLAQMICEVTLDPPDCAVAPLGAEDTDDVMELVALTEPGPFERGTLERGCSVGLRREGRLVAMAGERMKPRGHTEISAVCVHPDAQGRGLGETFVRAGGAPIQRAGDVPYLHVHTGNERAREARAPSDR